MDPVSAIANAVGGIIGFVDNLIPNAQSIPNKYNILDFQAKDNTSMYILLGLGVLLLLLLGGITYLAINK